MHQKPTPKRKTYTATETAIELNVDVSRVLFLCRQNRLGYTLPKRGTAWVITQNEIDTYRALGPRKSGPQPKPKVKRLARVNKDGKHDYV